MDRRDFAKSIQGRLWSVLEPLGYKKLKPNRFSRAVNDVLLYVDLQKGKYTTRERLELTVNLGVLSLPLHRLFGDDYYKPDIHRCHWRARVGDYMPEKMDKWWEIQTGEEAVAAGEEIARAVTTFGLPEMEMLSSTANLYALWKAGPGGWISDFQRETYVSMLEQNWVKKTYSAQS